MEIPKRSWIRYDGFHKLLTTDCENNCGYYRKINNTKICGWGVAFKYLSQVKKPKKCEVKNRKQTHNPSSKYLDEIRL